MLCYVFWSQVEYGIVCFIFIHITLIKPLKMEESLFFVSIVVVYGYVMVSKSVAVMIFCK